MFAVSFASYNTSLINALHHFVLTFPPLFLRHWPNMDLILAVTAVANGLEAWRIVEDSTNHIDLVLTEVVVPCLSGIGLLGKLMSHKTYMNIPVISECCLYTFHWKLDCTSFLVISFIEICNCYT